MNRGGRPLHNIYGELSFVHIKVENKNCAKCCFCEVIVKNTAKERLKAHRRICCRTNPQEPTLAECSQPRSTLEMSVEDEEMVDNPLQQEDLQTSCCGSSTSRTDLDMESTASASQPAKRSLSSTSGGTITSYIDTMNASEKKEIDLAVAKFVFGCNIPFSVVDSIHFKDLLQKLRPSYQSPGRKVISNRLLDDVYEEESKHCVEPDSVLLIDGWKNESNNTKNVVTMLHNVNASTGKPKSLFLEAFDLSGESETGNKLCEIVEEASEKAKTLYNTHIYCTVSDNASNMVKMSKCHQLWHSACNSHTANLLAKDLLPKNVSSKVNEVLKTFKHPDQQHQLLSFGGSRVCLAVDTRWCSQRDACASLKSNMTAMRKVAASDELAKISPQVKCLLFDEYFLSQVNDTIALLDPVSQLINACQKSDSSVADAVEMWMSLQLPDGHNDKHHHLEKRRKQSLNIYSMSANVLHPQYQGQNLNEQHHDQVEGFILKTLDAEGLSSFQQYREKAGIFGDLINKGIKSPKTFWFFAKRHHKQLADLANKLLNIPASSAQLERVFSNWSFVHNANRNRLSFEKSKKLVQVYYSLKMKDQACDDY